MKAVTTGKSLAVELMKNVTIGNFKEFDEIYQEVLTKLKNNPYPRILKTSS